MPEEEMSAPVSTPKKTIESIVKESFFSEMEKLKEKNEELKAELAKLSKVDAIANEATELSETPTPISFNPENEAKTEFTKIGKKAPRGIMDSVLEKINK
jgi:cell shape-determining protein MreC